LVISLFNNYCIATEGCWLKEGQSQSSFTTQGSCYTIPCHFSSSLPRSLQENRDILIETLSLQRCTNSCNLWSALSLAERYIFLMSTAYFASSASYLYPDTMNNNETALDHATILYSINSAKAGEGIDGSGRGGFDYNRIYVGFDDFAKCVIRNYNQANPDKNKNRNMWVKSDDFAGPHTPFTQREMIYWYAEWYELQSNGPQWHHWHLDSDFRQAGLNERLGVCGVNNTSLTEMTIAFDFFHNSNPLGDYAGRGGYGWQIVDKHVGLVVNWKYTPTGCPVTDPINTDTYGGGTFNGMGSCLDKSGHCLPPTYTYCK